MKRDLTHLQLSRDELLVLFEWAHRFCETGKLAFSHHAEAVVIDKIAGELERTLAEPFSSEYPQLLSEARTRVLDAYDAHMSHESWIKQQTLDQV